MQRVPQISPASFESCYKNLKVSKGYYCGRATGGLSFAERRALYGRAHRHTTEVRDDVLNAIAHIPTRSLPSVVENRFFTKLSDRDFMESLSGSLKKASMREAARLAP